MIVSAPPAVPARAYRWNRANYSRTRRVIDIWGFFLLILFYRWWDSKKWTYRGDDSEEHRSRRQRKRAIWTRETMLELGPTFIKVGQLFSTRADLFPKEYIEELSRLQDEVPAFAYEQVVQTIESEFGRRLPEIFQFFDPTPMAAASLGQVHRAQLHTGEEVVVKVQRPGLEQLFNVDLGILRGIAQYLQNHPRYGRGGREWVPIYDECARILMQEIDYLNEGRNADTFRRNFQGDPEICVPRVYWRYASPKVLTLEYLPGIKISNYEALEAAGLDRKLLARIGARSYLQQLLNDGFFHADPHPGNIAVRHDGALIFYDFGMMGRIQPGTKERLMDTFLGVAQSDADKVIDSLIELGAIKKNADRVPIRRSIAFLIENFFNKPYGDQSFDFGSLSEDIYEMAYEQPFRFPATFTFVLRAVSTLEGLGKGLDPNFNFMDVAQPFADQLMTTNGEFGMRELLNQLGQQVGQVGAMTVNLPRRIEQTLERADRGELRVRVKSIESERLLRRLNAAAIGGIYSVLLGAMLICSVILYTSEHILEAIAAFGLCGLLSFALGRVLLRLQRVDADIN
ncbi:ubiquinone biosynthesis protein UbiB [Gloeobacter kilaueensis JS1]|uniref:Ubiquinone biosynthesis protein UbiB n=1 Tax=Gloeobacter kilaueensis (strain ATCC BAA-2537 / CCAP 1431/1 / ULC 316 / JS1) TaxID=1183438 RepID=U5QFG1_GLOK1|nr:ubiquinone biosynthesis protein UbiB [Gloeobacter kilaueensis JS1]